MRDPYPDWPRTRWPDSLWRAGLDQRRFDPVPGDVDTDVLIVGAGFTGLWTAWHLTELDPGLRVMIIDAMQPGYGASGRNGGWCTAMMPMSLGGISRRYGDSAAIRMQNALVSSVHDIGAFVAEHGISCGWTLGGSLSVAMNRTQLDRADATVREFAGFGFDGSHIRLLDGAQVRSRVNCPGAMGGWYSPNCAALDPARLVDGLVRVLDRRNVSVHGSSRVRGIAPGSSDVLTPDGTHTVTARWTVRATEGFTPAIRNLRRTIAPVHSYMIATEPLGPAVWNELGWSGRETFTDGRHTIIYAQRTSDDRIAFGGRGAPYSFGSGTGPDFDEDRRIHDRIVSTMHELFPATRDARITHRWGGALGVPRDWFTGVTIDRPNSLASAGGYVGDGVAFSQLAAKALANCLLDTDDPSTRLPFVGHRSRSWEPEPFRWIGINAMLRIGSIADALESRDSRLAPAATWMLDRVVG